MAAGSSSSWEETDVDTGPVRLHLHRLSGAGTPLLLLHGLGVSGAVWRSFARRLAPPFAPLAPDLRGHGESGPAPPRPSPEGGQGYEPADYAGDLTRLSDALRIERLPVLGHSLGALVALALAGAAPSRVAALVLLDPPLDEARPNPDVETVYRLRHGPPGALEEYLAADDGAPAVARALATLFRKAADGVFEAHLRAPGGAPWAWELAPRLSMPVLVVQADPTLGGLLGDAAAEAFVERLPAGQRLRLPGARHAIHASQPGPLAEAVLRFLS
ncbi:MAG TPA: alpha/beta fold hydrolase [Chloroflexota bacterium]|jgi:pimeloyl-ACP methyl ester carboxylesterase|nr:alpha/beta fold hydrolase [Chloroflexota bacterium]